MRRAVAVVAWFGLLTTSANAVTFQRSTAARMRAAIDGVCDVYNARPNLIRHVQLARVHDTPGAGGTWKLSSDAAVTKLENAGSIDADFADVFSRDGKITYAIYTRGDATGDGGAAREYCYVNGLLARASAKIVDTSTDHEISRKLYVNARGDLFADTGELVRDIAKRRNADVPQVAPPALPIDPYMTPEKLPFYAAYRAAVAGTLPSL